MPGKPKNPKALVPVEKKRSATRSGNVPSTPKLLTDAALLPILGSERAVAKLIGSGGSVVHDRGATLVTGRSYATRGQTLPADEVYFVREHSPRADGPWRGEADKVAWSDPATEYDCIMMRNPAGGYLSGYVGVPVGHPLWGWAHRAIPSDIGIDVHGGLTYSKVCQSERDPVTIAAEAVRVCHAPPVRLKAAKTPDAQKFKVADEHAWWFGFDCNHPYDVVPGEERRDRRSLAAEIGATYRDDAYVVQEVLNLAAQLRAIADGSPMPQREGHPLPPIGLDRK